jgi:hypothetical protein
MTETKALDKNVFDIFTKLIEAEFDRAMESTRKPPLKRVEIKALRTHHYSNPQMEEAEVLEDRDDGT